MLTQERTNLTVQIKGPTHRPSLGPFILLSSDKGSDSSSHISSRDERRNTRPSPRRQMSSQPSYASLLAAVSSLPAPPSFRAAVVSSSSLLQPVSSSNMQCAGDGSCNCGCDILLADDFARQVQVTSVQMGGLRMGGGECCAKTPSISPSQQFQRDQDEGTDFGWLCIAG